jgi:NitT/TauT family transport system substrate-binding protein
MVINTPAICLAPQYIAEELLKAEGFSDIQYVKAESSSQALASGDADISMTPLWGFVSHADAGAPLVMLAGVHLGCYELFGTERVRSIRDLRGKSVPVFPLGGPEHLFLSSMAAYVGIDPHREINWITKPAAEAMELLAEDKVDAFLGFPPEPQELRAKKVGHVVVNTATDRPWSQYYCCVAGGR